MNTYNLRHQGKLIMKDVSETDLLAKKEEVARIIWLGSRKAPDICLDEIEAELTGIK